MLFRYQKQAQLQLHHQQQQTMLLVLKRLLHMPVFLLYPLLAKWQPYKMPYE